MRAAILDYNTCLHSELTPRNIPCGQWSNDHSAASCWPVGVPPWPLDIQAKRLSRCDKVASSRRHEASMVEFSWVILPAHTIQKEQNVHGKLPRSLDSILARTHCVHDLHSLGSNPARRYLTLKNWLTNYDGRILPCQMILVPWRDSNPQPLHLQSSALNHSTTTLLTIFVKNHCTGMW